MNEFRPPVAPTPPLRPVKPQAGQRPSASSVPRPGRAAVPPPEPIGAPPPDNILYQPDPTLEQRQLPFEPTGWYEQTTGFAPITLQLNSAGRVVVGWLTLPPGRSFAELAKLESLPRGEVLSCAVFIVDARVARQDGSYPMHWLMDHQPLGSPNTADPPNLLRDNQPDASRVGVGSFRYASPGRIELAFHPGGPSDKFTQYATGPRLPSAALISADPAARELLIIHHLSPMAPRWIADVIRTLTDATTVRRLKEWHSTRGDLPVVTKIARRAFIKGLYCPALVPGALPEAHRVALRGLVQTTLSLIELTIEGTTHSVWDWFRIVASTETDENERKPLKYLGFIDVERSTGFAYILDFNGVTPDRSGTMAGMKADALAFILRVRRVKVDFVMDKGAPKLDEAGDLEVTDPDALKAAEDEVVPLQPQGKPQLSTYVDGPGQFLFGIMGTIGAGLEIDLIKFFKSGNFITAASGAGGSATTSITFLTSANLTVEDFRGAWYQNISLGGPAAGNKAFSYTAASSSLHILSLANGMQLSRVKTEVNKPAWKGPPTKEIANGLQGNFDWFTGLFKPKATAGKVSTSLARIQLINRRSDAPPEPPRTVVPQRPIETVARTTTLFRRDEPFLIRSSADALGDARILLETAFATYRAGLSAGRSSVTITGYASPEGDLKHNEWLSMARAATVERALELGCSWRHATITKQGLGERPARKTGLKDPPLAPGELKAWMQAKENRDDVEKWPEWRRVELKIEGTVVLTGKW